MEHYAEKVLSSFFQQFYDVRISTAIKAGNDYKEFMDIPLASFWFSVIDFYGGVYYTGKVKPQYHSNKKRDLKLASGASFKKFIEDFFPEPENKLGDFIYNIFRSGIVHQISPKKGGLIWQPNNQKLIWITEESINPNEESNKIAFLNVATLQNLAFSAYNKFKKKIEQNELTKVCQKISETLIEPYDAFLDEQNLNQEINKLDEELKQYLIVHKID